MSRLQLKKSQKILYAVGDFSQLGVENLLRLFLLFYLTEFVGFRPTVASWVLVGGVIWDAVSDPLMAWFSDRVYLKLKGRFVLVYVGALLSGSFIGLVFTSHLWLPKNPLLFLILYILMNTAMTIYAVPHTSIPGDFPFSAKLRTNIFAWRFAFGNFGSLIAAIMVALLQGIDSTQNFLLVILTFSFFNLLISGLSALGTQQIETSLPLKEQGHTPGWEAFLNTFKNSAYPPLLLGYLLANIGVGISSASALYYYKDYLKLPEKETGIILIVFFFVIALSLAGWAKLSEKFGKLKPLQLGSFVLGAGTCVAYPLFPIGNFWWPLFVGGVFLGAMVGCVILLDSLLTDVADFGELKDGSATTAVYFGIWKFTSKLARAIALALTGVVIEGQLEIGAPAGEQIASERLPWLFGPGVGSFLLVASLLMSLYRFNDKKQAKVSVLLDKKNSRRSV